MKINLDCIFSDISKEQDSSIIDSCNDLQDGESSGIYKIKPPGSSKAMQVVVMLKVKLKNVPKIIVRYSI